MVSSPSEPAVVATERGLLVQVRVGPSASRTAFRGSYGDRMKVSLSAPPENNRANTELVRVLTDWLGLPKGGVSIHSGHTSKDKTVLFTDITEDLLRSRLAALVEESRSASARRRKKKGARRKKGRGGVVRP